MRLSDPKGKKEDRISFNKENENNPFFSKNNDNDVSFIFVYCK